MTSRKTAYRRPPDWKPSVAEAIVETAATLEPQERYGSAIFKAAGFKDNDARHVFHSIIEHGILRYSGPAVGRQARLVDFTEHSLEQTLDAITSRIEQLEVVREAMLRLSGVDVSTQQEPTRSALQAHAELGSPGSTL